MFVKNKKEDPSIPILSLYVSFSLSPPLPLLSRACVPLHDGRAFVCAQAEVDYQPHSWQTTNGHIRTRTLQTQLRSLWDDAPKEAVGERRAK